MEGAFERIEAADADGTTMRLRGIVLNEIFVKEVRAAFDALDSTQVKVGSLIEAVMAKLAETGDDYDAYGVEQALNYLLEQEEIALSAFELAPAGV